MEAVKHYNKIMESIDREYLTIGTSHSENTYGWNLRDMVSEMQYTLNIYQDENCIYWEDAHNETQGDGMPWLKEWKNDVAKMKRFIEKYKVEAMKMQCTAEHCSEFD